MSQKKASLRILYLSGFIDYAGIAIVYPIFAYLFFEPSLNFFPAETSELTRGFWLGILVALYPFLQFFSAPIFGALSDRQGRKNLLLVTLVISALGYFFALLGILFHSIGLLALYRILVGIGAGNGSILGAMVADLSKPEEKSRHFGRLSMSFGAGFTIAPFFGGILVKQGGYLWPFLIPFILVFMNIIFVFWKIKETHAIAEKVRVPLFKSLVLIRRAAQLEGLRLLFMAVFVYTLGWAFFTEFLPLFLLYQYDFDPSRTGIYYGYSGVFYALSAGFLVPPIVSRLSPSRVLPLAQILAGISVAGLLFVIKPSVLWFYMPLVNFFMAFIYPTTSTVISNKASDQVQGEAMGVYQAVTALAMALCPFVSGSLASAHPWVVVVLGGGLMALGGAFLSLFPARSATLSSVEAAEVVDKK